MLTKERGISVVSGLVFFLAGLYLFALMASDISLRSFFVVISFAVVSLFLSATISHNLAQDSSEKTNRGPTTLAFQEKINALKTENLRLKGLLEVEAAKTVVASNVTSLDSQANGLMLRQRAFIHDIAGPVSIVQGMIEMSMKALEADPKNAILAKAKLERALISVSKISQKVQENRDFLIMAAS